ncbi:MAG TPA: helix-turn-helix domain-containing protein [Candidatus Cybelea sp.]|jgi:AraC-like DNA-binding protein
MILFDQAGAGASGARFFPPLRTQEPFIEHFWIQQTCSTPAWRTWRIISDANPYLIFMVSREGSRVQGRCALIGPRSRFVDVTMANRILTCGARLRPGALPLLTHCPASDFTDRSFPVEDVFGADGKLLVERLEELRSPLRAISIISDFFTHKWMDQNRVARLPLGPYTRVEDMAAQTRLPLRTLRSRFTHHVGLSPKRVIRIERLYRALANSHGRSIAWAEIAASSGFADQAHMIREFHDLLGESPTAWSRRSRLPISSRQ